MKRVSRQSKSSIAYTFLEGFGTESRDGWELIGERAALGLYLARPEPKPKAFFEFAVAPGQHDLPPSQILIYEGFLPRQIVPLPEPGRCIAVELDLLSIATTPSTVHLSLFSITQTGSGPSTRPKVHIRRIGGTAVPATASFPVLGSAPIPATRWRFVNVTAKHWQNEPLGPVNGADFAAVFESPAPDTGREHSLEVAATREPVRPCTLTFLFNPQGIDGVRCVIVEPPPHKRHAIVDIDVLPHPEIIVHPLPSPDTHIFGATLQPLDNGWYRGSIAVLVPNRHLTASISMRRDRRVIYPGDVERGLIIGAIEFEQRLLPTMSSLRPRPPRSMNWPCETHRYFLVCSQGNAGSIWTARAFNLHDGLVCSMGNDHPIISMNETHPFNSLPDAAIETLTAAWTDRIVDAEDIALGVTQEESRARQLLREILERKGMLMDIPRRIPPLTPGETFAELERFHAGHIFGNVHGLTLTNLQRAAGRRGSYRFPVANLIRHPISRLQALIGRTIDIMPARTDLGPEREAAMNAHAALRAALTRYDVNWRDSRNRFRFWAVMGLRALEGWTTEIRDHPEIRHIPIERLMRDPSYFAETLTFLTAGGVTPDTAYLDTVFAPGRRHIGRMHPHATARPNPSEWEIFDAWPTWLQHIVREELNRLDAAPLYARFGYDLSFL